MNKNPEQKIWPVMGNGNDGVHLMLFPLNEFVTIDSKVLDLCTLNKNGVASTKLDNTQLHQSLKHISLMIMFNLD